MSESEYQESLERIAEAAQARTRAAAALAEAKDAYNDARDVFKQACKEEQRVIDQETTELPLFDRPDRTATGSV